ncbi:ubiquitin-related domain-containing protein [Poronia punctata]|nr:ubiquitin-related domain-containing protein [Poronia punctata]
MSDRAASPPTSRHNSPSSRPSVRNAHRSRSPRSHDDWNRDNRRPHDNYRSLDDTSDRSDRYKSSRDDRRSRDANWSGARGRQDRYRDENRRGRDNGRDPGDDPKEHGDGGMPRPKRGFGGLRYKEKRRHDDLDQDSSRRGGTYRGYRNRSPSPRRRDRDPDRDRTEPASSFKKPRNKPSDTDTSKPPTRALAAPATGGEEMIIVHVNDRLGTKAAIPCFASDYIKDFKIMVAARIGREPHEILLRRQGQRPFKDMLKLEDYEISNGVQLDLEVDTGD